MDEPDLFNERYEKISVNKSLLDYAIEISDNYARTKTLGQRKLRGQFFTPKKVCTLIGDTLNINEKSIRLLDAGAGAGNLTAAFCDKVLKTKGSRVIFVDAYENDPELIDSLKNVLETCKIELEAKGHDFIYNIIEDDFIIRNQTFLTISSHSASQYDFCLLNPPYFKLDKESDKAIIMRKFISGHPNIYALFMALSIKLLKNNGEAVFITPRSFCSGFYYKKFREWLLKEIQIERVFLFETRRTLFNNGPVLQETILMKAKKSQTEQATRITCINSSPLNSSHDELSITRQDIAYEKNGELFIRLPSSLKDLATIKLVDNWKKTLSDLELKASTGPVVVFRSKNNLKYEDADLRNHAPLIWMHNFENQKIRWPKAKKQKPIAIADNDETKSLLLPLGNYVLVKRVSSKEQERRLSAAALLAEDFKTPHIGIENHVNYIQRSSGMLTVEETIGLTAVLNSSIVDNFFRSLNGNTQVNAVDLRSLPLPTIEQIRDIGSKITLTDHPDLDEIIQGLLNKECLLTF